jgi:hypothetical protein
MYNTMKAFIQCMISSNIWEVRRGGLKCTQAAVAVV